MIEADPIGCRAAGRYGTVDHLLGARGVVVTERFLTSWPPVSSIR
ncbi:hypothetical protein ACH474_03890 [Nocardia rhamnosiphila]